MRFCQAHWDALRHAIQARGLGDFMAWSGPEAMKQAKRDLEGKKITKKADYDPLMSAHWMIVGNAMQELQAIGVNPLSLMAHEAEHPEMNCPICCLNWHSANHDRICTNPDCKKPRGLTYDNWIDKAADGAAGFMKTLE